MSHLAHEMMRSIYRFNLEDWALVFGAVLSLGFFCLKGFGSRSSY